MEFKDWLTLGLAMWGAGLSSVLGWVKLGEYRRNLKIYHEYQAFVEVCHLVIVNMGQRPVTIQRIVARNDFDGWAGFTVLAENQEGALPVKLMYGDPATFVLDNEVGHPLFMPGDEHLNLELIVYDSEGNEYRPTHKRMYSPRYEGYSKFEKLKFKKSQNRPL